MIVRPAGDRILLISQPAHARLAGALMAHCAALAAHPRRDSILRATSEHDNGWELEDAAPRVDPVSGKVLDFVAVPVGVRQAPWPRTLAQLAGDPWAAALVAHHAVAVYARFRQDAEWTAFFAEMQAARDAFLGASGLPLEDLAADYRFVRLGDLVSLVFCTGATAEQRYEGWILRLGGTRVGVTPCPFGNADVPLEIEGRELLAREYSSDAALREALRAAPTTTLHGVVGAGLQA